MSVWLSGSLVLFISLLNCYVSLSLSSVFPLLLIVLALALFKHSYLIISEILNLNLFILEFPNIFLNSRSLYMFMLLAWL